MANYQYGADIVQDVLKRASELQALTGTVSDYLPDVKRYVMRAYYDLLKVFPWPWALSNSPGIISTVDKITDTATVNHDSATLTLGTGTATDITGRKIYVDNERILYRVSTYSNPTVTLDATYKETSVSGGACTVIQDEYSLASDCLRPWRFWFRNRPETEIDFTSPADLFRKQRFYSNAPYKITQIREDKIRFHPYLEESATIEYEYTARPATLDWAGTGSGDTPVVEETDRHVLADWALALLLLDKNDPRAAAHSSVKDTKITRMIEFHAPMLKPRLFVRKGKGLGG